MVKPPLRFAVTGILKPSGPVTEMATGWRAAKPEPVIVMGSLLVQTEHETNSVGDEGLGAFPAESARVMVTSRVRRTITLFMVESMPGIY